MFVSSIPGPSDVIPAIVPAALSEGVDMPLSLFHPTLFLGCLALHLALTRRRNRRWGGCAMILPALVILAAAAVHVWASLTHPLMGLRIQEIAEMIAASAALFSVVMDILAHPAKSKLEETEARLRQWDTQLASASRVARLCRFSVNLASHRVDWCGEALGLFGWSALDGSRPDSIDEVMALIHPDDRDAVHKTVARAMDSHTPFEFQARLMRGGARTVAIHARGDLGHDAEGKVIALHGVVQDVDTLMTALEDRAQAQAEAEAATRVSATKTAFISTMSHELRTPLNAIIGYSELLSMRADQMTPDRMRQDLGNILQAGHHLLDLINDILDMAKIESGQAELDASTFTVQAVIDEALPLVTPLLETNGDSLHVEGTALESLVTADRMKLRQCLVNLLGNAAKFTKQGIVSLSADITSKGELALSVADTGIGLTQDQIDGLFVAFRQAERSTAASFGGTGLGLAITRAHCRLMGGDIAVTSNLGTGACFTMTLPILTTPVTSLTPDGPALGPSPLDVLVVEDDRAYGELLSRLLTGAGWATSVARTGEQALEVLALRNPRICVVDLVLPDLDGFEVLRHAQHQISHPGRILALTSLDLTLEQRDELDGRGAEILLKRDISISKVSDHIQNLLEEFVGAADRAPEKSR